MRNPFQRSRPRADLATLGTKSLAVRADGAVPPGCVGVVADAAGRTRRVAAGRRLDCGAGESAWCLHPGPYSTDLTPFAQAPEMGLHVCYAIDSADPRLDQQRFDLYLVSEAGAQVDAAGFSAALDAALQGALAQGKLALPPCTQPDEWDAFRAGLDELFYTRFGIVLDECMPVDLRGVRDYAAMLAARTPEASAPAVTQAAPAPPAIGDRAALRRLFLELPVLRSRVRMLTLADFARQRALVERFDHLALTAATMPALELAAPGQRLPDSVQQSRTRHAVRAVAALDEAWALLSRAGAIDMDSLCDELERVAANIEHATAARRATQETP